MILTSSFDNWMTIMLMLNNSEVFDIKIKTAGPDSKRKSSYKCYLKTIIILKFNVSSLGYDINNDRVLKNFRSTDRSSIATKFDRGDRQPCPHKIDKQLIVDHFKIFKPSVSHYSREHAPERQYLLSDLNIMMMYNNFRKKNPALKGSYEGYKKIVSDDLNISFSKLGHEQCWKCEGQDLHVAKSKHIKNGEIADCENCQNWKEHQFPRRISKRCQ